MFTSRSPRHPALAGVVDRLWWSEADVVHDTETILPTGRGQLIFDLRPGAPREALLQGPRSTAVAVDPTPQRRAVGVALASGGTTSLVAGPASELADRFVALDELWAGTEALVGELAEIGGPDAAFDRLERELVRRLDPDRATDRPLEAAEAALANGATVGEVAALVDMDRRRLGERFAERFGFGPKRYGRIRRFERALRAIRRSGADPLSRIAADLGYADQAHLSREIRDFAGVTARELGRVETDAPTHLRPPGASFKTAPGGHPNIDG